MANQHEELYVDDILGGLEVPIDLLPLAEAAKRNSFPERLQRIREALGVSPTGITLVRIPIDAGYNEVIVAPTRLPGHDLNSGLQRWIFLQPAHDVQDFTVDTTMVRDYFVNPNGQPRESVAGFSTVRPRIRDPEDFLADYGPHIEFGREHTDGIELFLGKVYEAAVKERASREFGNTLEVSFLDRAVAIPASCAETVTEELTLREVA